MKNKYTYKELKQELYNAHKRLKEIQQIAHLGDWELDIINNKLIWSDEIYRIFNLNPQEIEISYEQFLALIHPEDKDMVNKSYLKSLKDKTPYLVEHRILLPSGDVKYVLERCKTYYNDEGIPTHSIGTILDITNQYKLKDTLRKSEEKYRAIVENTSEWIWEMDGTGVIIYSNSVVEQILGYSRSELIGKNNISLIHKLDRERVAEIFLKKVKLKESWKDLELRWGHKEGGYRYLESSAIPILNKEGILQGFRGVNRDVTKRKEAEKKLNKALIKAKESDKLKSIFLASMSHEIRTPMNSIIGFSEFLLESSIPENKRKDYAEIIITNSKQLLAIVNDILDFSKIEAGVVQLHYQSVNLNKMLNDLYVFYKPIAIDNNLMLMCKLGLENDKSVINIDSTKLNQILTNLLSNAIKFTKEGEVEFGYKLIKNNLQFYVKDTGEGIDEKLKNKIFDRFFQGNLDLVKQHTGTGLGLAISKNFVELFNGKIWFISNEKGTTFYFTIPYIKNKEPLNPTAFTSKKEQIKRGITKKTKETTILVAEDEEYNMMYINVLFSKRNFKIIEANNGKQAVEMFKKHPEVDLVLMDIQMPIMNGNEAMKEIKKIKPSIPVIAISAFAMESDKEKSLKKGFDFYISKPIDKKLLFDTIKEYSFKRKVS
ncbi:PAS domain-containing protein [Lutibacter sp.]